MTIADVQEMAEKIRAAVGAPIVTIVVGEDDGNAFKIVAKERGKR